jgi:hypothetical protein
MVSIVTHPSHQVLFTTTAALCIDDLIDHVFFGTVLRDHGTRSSKFTVRKQCGVVWNEWLQEAGVETWEGLWVVG